jgi:hypothetical protein
MNASSSRPSLARGYYAVNDRPVKLVECENGSGDALAFDGKTGGFVPDRSYFARTPRTLEHGKDIDQLTEAQFTAIVAALRLPICETLHAMPLVWEHTGDGEVPYRTTIGERVLTVRVNDFPAEPLYTLLVDGDEVEHLEDWPEAWQKPATPQARLDKLGIKAGS